jgi:plastocyanin
MLRSIVPWMVLAAGCVGRSDAATPPAVSPTPRAAQSTPVGAGRITGRVVWHGAHPATATTTIPPEHAACGGSTPFTALRIGADEGVQDAIITVTSSSHVAATPAAVTIDQHDCVFDPHVVVAPIGSRLTFSNHDAVLHSVHAYRDAASEFNLATPPGLTVSRVEPAAALLRLQCDTGHTWMSGWIDIVETPWFAVTDAHGAFRIEHLPPGTYTLQMWHEGWVPQSTVDGRITYSAPVTRTATVAIRGASGAAEHDFALP